jgi:hypothetical protein
MLLVAIAIALGASLIAAAFLIGPRPPRRQGFDSAHFDRLLRELRADESRPWRRP